MNKIKRFSSGASLLLLAALLSLPMGALAQTPIKAPSNKFSLSDDVKLGREAAAEVERQLPVMNDRTIQAYVEEIGLRLVENQEEEAKVRLKALREAARKGIADVEAGRYRTFESPTKLRDHLGTLRDDVVSRKRKRSGG